MSPYISPKAFYESGYIAALERAKLQLTMLEEQARVATPELQRSEWLSEFSVQELQSEIDRRLNTQP